MIQTKVWFTDARLPKMVVLLLIALIIWALVSPSMVSAMAGFGGYISEKLLGDGTNEMLYLGDGTNELTVLGLAPVVSTGTATSSSAGNVVTMTVTGNLQDLNGMPRADTYFQWGYSSGGLSNTTTTSTETTTGIKTAIINPDAGEDVYYRFVASTDGTAYGSIQYLPIVGGGHGISYWMLNTLLPIVIAMIILIGVLLLTSNPIVALISAVIGLVGFYIILALVSLF